ncbi:MAG: hypothetical protein ABSG64_00255 [Solirubrobacteraceae bacterium]
MEAAPTRQPTAPERDALTLPGALRVKLASRSRSEKVALALIGVAFIAGAVLRLHAIGTNQRLSVDEFGYVNNADRMLRGESWGSFNWAPGTPALFALAAWLRGYANIAPITHSHGIAQHVQWLVEMTTLVLVGVFAWRIGGLWAAFVAVAAMATYPSLIEVTRTYLSEPLGGLMLVAMVVAAAWARRRTLTGTGGWRWLIAAGVVGGLACLAREDFLPGIAVIAVALALDARGDRRRAIGRAAIYAVAALATLAPWVAFASNKNGRFVTVTTGGTDALFIGTYLPGDGNQFQTTQAFRPAVCRRFPKECHFPDNDAAPMFQLITAEHPGDNRNQAVTAAVLSNLSKYALGQPVSFAQMLVRKAWEMWWDPWSGGNSATGRPDTSTTVHRIYVVLAWLGLLIGGLLYRRRWSVIVPTAVFVVVIAVNDWFGPEPRDSVRLSPLLFALGAVGLVAGLRWAIARRSGPGTLAPST